MTQDDLDDLQAYLASKKSKHVIRAKPDPAGTGADKFQPFANIGTGTAEWGEQFRGDVEQDVVAALE